MTVRNEANLKLEEVLAMTRAADDEQAEEKRDLEMQLASEQARNADLSIRLTEAEATVQRQAEQLEDEQNLNYTLHAQWLDAKETVATQAEQLQEKQRQIDALADELKETQRAKADPDAEAVIGGLKEQITTQADRIKELEGQLRELEDELVTRTGIYARVCDDRDEAHSRLREMTAERDAWKQVTKWLVKRIGGEPACS